jgi:hypothetical protein
MKLVSLIPALCIATLFVSAPLRAEDAPKKGEKHAKMVERFDVDGDGQLNEAEKAKAREAMKEKGGGEIREKAKAKRGEMLKRFDIPSAAHSKPILRPIPIPIP